MIRTCDGSDPNLIGGDGHSPCGCGMIFDDVDQMVIYPHDDIPGRAEKDELWDKVQLMAGVPYVWGSGAPTERGLIEP